MQRVAARESGFGFGMDPKLGELKHTKDVRASERMHERPAKVKIVGFNLCASSFFNYTRVFFWNLFFLFLNRNN